MKMMAHSRKLLLLLADDEEANSSLSLRNKLSPTITYSPDPELLPPLNTSSSGATASGSPELTNTPSNSPFDSSMALTILVLLTALFFMAFFSVYIRRVSDEASDLHRRRQHHSPASSSSSSLRFCPSKGRGLDPSTVGSLPLIAYRGHATQLIDCVICLSEFEERETVKMIPCCRHVFHPGCIDTWLTSHVSCPLCLSTKMYGVEEVCLNVMQVDDDQSVRADSGRRSTVEESDTWTGGGPVGLRRTCSWSSLGQRVALQRSRSF